MVYKITRTGDRCDHGATVITGDPTRIVNDRKVARVGDLVYCPKLYPSKRPHGVNPIISTVAVVVETTEKRTAHLVSRTACGATLITGSEDTIIDRKPDSDA